MILEVECMPSLSGQRSLGIPIYYIAVTFCTIRSTVCELAMLLNAVP